MNVLYLTPWYPSEQDTMSGLFVQKHLEAVRAQGVDVRVIHSQRLCDSWRQWKALQREGWIPDVVQLNVIQKQGLLALWLKKRYGIPYIIVEHWSGYLPENGQFMQLPFLSRRRYQYIARQAAIILTVSNRHAQAMRACGMNNEHWGRINNVVDDFFFVQQDHERTNDQRPTTNDQRPTIFLHVSCFDERSKNVKGLLRAAKKLSDKRRDWRFVLVGSGVDYQDVRDYAESLSFPEGMLRWTGELTPREVSNEFDKADVFVMSSNYENAPVVISESLVKGVPIVATNVGGIPEMVNERCGLLVPPKDDKLLYEALERMVDNHSQYDSEYIRLLGEQYSFATVGAQLKQIYEQVLSF